MSITNRIAMLRERLGLTQESFAQVLGCTGMRISYYESGEAEPKPEDLQKLCRSYQVSYEWLMENENAPMFEDGVLLFNDRESVSQRLKALRKEKHLTQKVLAEKIAVQ